MEISYASSSSRNLSRYSSSSHMPNRPVKVIPLLHPTASSAPSSSSSLSLSVFSRWRSKVKAMSCTDWTDVLLPCSRWIRTYRWRDYLQIDLAAGLTVGVMLVPQVRFGSNFSCVLLNPYVAEKMWETEGNECFFFVFCFHFAEMERKEDRPN